MVKKVQDEAVHLRFAYRHYRQYNQGCMYTPEVSSRDFYSTFCEFCVLF